ncbi:MAG: peptidase M14 [Burkholderiales bacterium PBB3]|nr:MAG: peptidase M14 [Burkholderiales bacterium PBB3]
MQKLRPPTWLPSVLAWGLLWLGSSVLAAPAAATAPVPASQKLSTASERSGFTVTGRYTEAVALCQSFQKAYPGVVRCHRFGTTPEGRPMVALIASRSGVHSPAQARQKGLPVLLVQGGIHAGEIDGKDAGFMALRELLDQRQAPGALKRQVLIFVPVFNVDGHERFGAWNRPNQRGPEAMGWRTTAQNYNLNRDYAKADSPEMQAMLGLVNAWDPILTVDLHVTDGAKFEHDIAIMVEPVHAGDAALRPIGLALRTAVLSDLTAAGSSPLPFYPSFVVEDDPSSGFADGVSAPRFSTGYFLTRNRFGMLVETHSWKTYPERVRSTFHTVVSVVQQTAQHGTAWLAAARLADAHAAQLGGHSVALSYEASPQSRSIAFKGYAYTRTLSEVSGALMTRYDESTPQVWNIPLRDDVQPSISAAAPHQGYWVPAAFAPLVRAKLQQHGITYRTHAAAQPPVSLEVFRATQAQWDAKSTEGHQRLNLQGSWAPEQRSLPAGSLFVPIAQPKARLVMALLEPLAPDALVAWGAFNNAFEAKEYMEAYVAEDVARAQLAADPALARAFADRLAADPAFAKSPQARLEFFARRHTSWDERYQLYPVMRLNTPPTP